MNDITIYVQNMEAWEEAKKEIALIPDHPNRLPEGTTEESNGKAGPSSPSARRLSSGRLSSGRGL